MASWRCRCSSCHKHQPSRQEEGTAPPLPRGMNENPSSHSDSNVLLPRLVLVEWNSAEPDTHSLAVSKMQMHVRSAPQSVSLVCTAHSSVSISRYGTRAEFSGDFGHTEHALSYSIKLGSFVGNYGSFPPFCWTALMMKGTLLCMYT